MSMPHNTVQDAESARIATETALFIDSGGIVNKDAARVLEGNYRVIHAYCIAEIDRTGKSVTKNRICRDTGLSSQCVTQCLRVLEDNQRVKKPKLM